MDIQEAASLVAGIIFVGILVKLENQHIRSVRAKWFNPNGRERIAKRRFLRKKTRLIKNK